MVAVLVVDDVGQQLAGVVGRCLASMNILCTDIIDELHLSWL
jgi:hypothetical protein